MSDRADAHIHLFEKGFHVSFTGRPGVTIDETALYASLAKDHRVRQALVVGYEGEEWATGNNDYVAGKAREHDWVRPTAFFRPDAPPDVAALERLRERRFVGISLYTYGEASVRAVAAIPDTTWSWLAEHRWLVSLNARVTDLAAWPAILERHQELRVLLSHLGVPARVKTPPPADEARRTMSDVLALAQYPGAHVKLSGFYAITDPDHAYPHRAAWPFVETLLDHFTADRLLWGSDFTPSLDSLTFPQTLDVFAEIPFLNDDHRRRIQGENLLRLLAEVE